MAKDSVKKELKGLGAGDYYYTAEGFLVFTEKYHRKRGYCCQNGCRHCPFGFDGIAGGSSSTWVSKE